VPAAALVPVDARADYATFLADLEGELGLTRIDNLDGTYHYELSSGLSTADQVGDLFTWRYVGQANYSWSPTVAPMPLSADDDQDTGDDPSEGLDDLEGTISTDQYGRKWRVVNVDPVAINYAIADYWSDVATNWGLEQAPAGAEPAQDLDALSSSLDPNYATSWAYGDCDADGEIDTAIWDGETRTSFHSPMSSPYHHAAAVQVRGPVGICSGVKVADNLVLTAAHCVVDPVTNDPLPVLLCPGASSADSGCVRSDRPIPSKGFAGLGNITTGNVRKDYAVVTFPGTLSNPRMSLSTDNRAKIKKRAPARVGFDAFRLLSGSCNAWPGNMGREHPSVAVQGTRSGLLRLRADASRGASGGPYYFMDSGHGRVVGVQSIYRSSGSGWVGGPRVNEFRKWAISLGAVVLEAP
jgi:V8-like Glu-specific endopeptidase